MIEIILNGDRRTIEREMPLTELLKTLGTPERGVAVACNARIVPRAERETIVVRSGDDVEIVTANPGG